MEKHQPAESRFLLCKRLGRAKPQPTSFTLSLLYIVVGDDDDSKLINPRVETKSMDMGNSILKCIQSTTNRKPA